MDWCVVNEEVLLLDSANDTLAFDLVDAPHLQRIAAQVDSVLQLERNIHVAFVEHAHGFGGLFDDGLVIVGIEEAVEIADTVAAGLGRCRNDHARSTRAMDPRAPVVTVEELRWSVLRFIVAHEFGHAQLCELGDCSLGMPNEARADFWAGRVAERLGWDRLWLDLRIARAIGCSDLVCTHPPPRGRVSAYASGRNYERRIQACIRMRRRRRI